MKKKDIAAVAASIAAVKVEHPKLYALLADLSSVFELSEIDPESELAKPAATLVTALQKSETFATMRKNVPASPDDASTLVF